MQKSYRFLIGVCLLYAGLLLGNETITQTNWQGGKTAESPVENWGTEFYDCSDINYLYRYGQISLAAILKEGMSPSYNNVGNMTSEREKQLEIGDLDDDGDMDVATAGNNDVRWYENEGDGVFETYSTIHESFASTYLGFALADFDSDGVNDAVVGSMHTGNVILFLNDGEGNFTQHTVVGSSNGYHVAAADFDNDGDIDVLSTPFRDSYSEIYWYENESDNENFTRHVVEDMGSTPERGINIGDLDSDGDMDFLANSHMGGYWYENKIDETGAEYCFDRHFLNTGGENHYDWIGDINRDGYLDLITVGLYSRSPTWWKNDGEGNFTKYLLPEGVDHPEAALSMDVDYDGDVDIVQAFWNFGTSGEVSWYENDGNENFTYHQFTFYAYACDLQIADVTGNGLLDLIIARHNPGQSIDWINVFDHYTSPGELTSTIFDAQDTCTWEEIDWDGECPEGTQIQFLIRTGNFPDKLPDWSNCDILNEPTSLATHVTQDTRYLQYQVILKSNKDDASPFLEEIRITYSHKSEITETSQISPSLYVIDNTIYYTLPTNKTGKLTVFDAAGRRIENLMVLSSGNLKLQKVPAGLYFVRLEYETGVISRKVVFVR